MEGVYLNGQYYDRNKSFSGPNYRVDYITGMESDPTYSFRQSDKVWDDFGKITDGDINSYAQRYASYSQVEVGIGLGGLVYPFWNQHFIITPSYNYVKTIRIKVTGSVMVNGNKNGDAYIVFQKNDTEIFNVSGKNVTLDKTFTVRDYVNNFNLYLISNNYIEWKFYDIEIKNLSPSGFFGIDSSGVIEFASGYESPQWRFIDSNGNEKSLQLVSPSDPSASGFRTLTSNGEYAFAKM